MNSEAQAKYYDDTDFANVMKNQKGKKFGFSPKRITMNISDKIYDEANELDSYMQMGYQNVLKTAMTIGLTQLYDQVSRHDVRKKKASGAPSWHARKRPLARKRQAAQQPTAARRAS